ncbi:hypothetical protein F8S13_11625 [Chloroflexia bacterium SDU3-3]|nr:hypothetical protein F8S13_11625 [Chloroflexia bacterium SDU3-3]
MSANTLWSPPSLEQIMAGFAVVRKTHPVTVTRTITLKLRTTRFKENMLRIAQQRVTMMTAEVLTLFQQDLAQVSCGQAGAQLPAALASLLDMGGRSLSPSEHHELEQFIAASACTIDPQHAPRALMSALAEASAHAGTAVEHVRAYLDDWDAAHGDLNLKNTLERVATMKNRDGTPRYSLRQLDQIRYAILLRKAMAEAHAVQVRAARMAALAEQAEQQRKDEERVRLIESDLRRRGAGKSSAQLITVLCAIARRYGDPQVADMQPSLLAELQRLAKEGNKKAHAPQLPFIRTVIHRLAASDEASGAGEGMGWLRRQVEYWYAHLPLDQQREIFGDAYVSVDGALRYAALLHALLQQFSMVSTATLLLLELTEAEIRQLGDGHEQFVALLSRCYSEHCSLHKYPLSGPLRQAIFASCGQSVLAWAQKLIDHHQKAQERHITLKAPKLDGAPSFQSVNLFYRKRLIYLPLIYQIWSASMDAYDLAASTTVPFGPDSGKTLGLTRRQRQQRRMRGNQRKSVLGDRFVGKRGARRLKRWMLAPKVVSEILEHLEVLEYPDIPGVSEQQRIAAKAAVHPYWVKKQHQPHGVRAVRPTQFRSQPTAHPVRLGQLSASQRFQLRQQMRELQAFAPEFERIREAIDLFLSPAPPDFPSLDTVMMTADEAAQLPLEVRDSVDQYEPRLTAYHQSLDLLRTFWPRRGSPSGNYTAEKLYDLETLRAQQFAQHAAELQERQLQPIRFQRTMNSQYSPASFTLVWRGPEAGGDAQESVLLACALAGEEAPERALLAQRGSQAEQQEEGVVQEFLNYPGHAFSRDRVPEMLFFPAEYGHGYQAQILRGVRERQRHAPIICQRGCTAAETGQHLPGCAPAAALATATLTSDVDAFGRALWFAHLPVEIPTPACAEQPNAIMGVHEDGGQLWFAVIDLHGAVLDVGELVPPAHVGPETAHGQASENFAYEMAWKILRQSHTDAYTAWIALEETGWKRDRVDINAAANRGRFAFPREKIASIVRYNAASEGMLPPTSMRGISPTSDCGHCGQRMEQGEVRYRAVYECPRCAALDVPNTLRRSDGEDAYRCTSCGSVWSEKIPQFKCLRCGAQQYARYNTALAVARRALERLSSQGASTAEE